MLYFRTNVRSSGATSVAPSSERGQVEGQGIVHYVEVEPVAEYVTRAESLGAKVVYPRSPVPGMGWFARFLDTEGNCLAIWESDKSTA